MKNKIATEDYIEEFKKLTNEENGTFLNSNRQENLPKTHDPKICFDHSRVVLTSEDGKSDFIDANFVDGYEQKNKFILTHGE